MKLLDYMALIINYLKNRRVGGGSIGVVWVSLFEAYNSVVARILGQADGKNESSGW